MYSRGPGENDLVKEVDVRKHIDHYSPTDPNRILYEEILRLYGEDRARKFLEYRKTFEKVKASRTPMDYPINVNIALNNSCNLHCPHCFREHLMARPTKNVLTREEVERALDQSAELGVPAVLLGAGSELFLHRDAMPIIEHAAKCGFLDIFIATNGQLLTPEIMDRLIDLRITRLCVSLDAATKETYAKVRGGDFEKLIANIDLFLEKRAAAGVRIPLLRVSFVDYHLNGHEKEQFIETWKGRADAVDVQALMAVKNVNEMKYDAIDAIDCAYPWNMLYLNWDGQFKPCCVGGYNEPLNVGNIETHTVKEAWNSEAMARHRRDMLDPDRFPRACINCMKSLKNDERFDPLN